ncbi:MAG: response regulator transcription factor [Stackebrandtia sp.]
MTASGCVGSRPALSERQNSVLNGIASGHTDRRVAKDLHMSERTVRREIENMLRLFEVDTRIELAVAATASGLLNWPADALAGERRADGATFR